MQGRKSKENLKIKKAQEIPIFSKVNGQFQRVKEEYFMSNKTEENKILKNVAKQSYHRLYTGWYHGNQR